MTAIARRHAGVLFAVAYRCSAGRSVLRGPRLTCTRGRGSQASPRPAREPRTAVPDPDCSEALGGRVPAPAGRGSRSSGRCATSASRSARARSLGIIGRNGAGKSTLLKILSRITAPTAGSIDGRRPRVGAARGRHGLPPRADRPREHLPERRRSSGMPRARDHAPASTRSSTSPGSARFIDTPVKRYSSGMCVRLAFAVAAHLEPEILVIDEVLAVGDAAFQRSATTGWRPSAATASRSC